MSRQAAGSFVSRAAAVIVAAFVLSFQSLAAAETLPPDKLVEQAVEEVFAVLRGDAGKDDKALAALIEARVVGRFDFGAMTRLAVGKHWRDATETQRAALVDAFRTLLLRTYSQALKSFADYRITYRPLVLEPGATKATVRTSASGGAGKPVPIDYRMKAGAEGWKVYDVLVEGVSLVINYRNMFGSAVDRSGIDGLVKLLRDKNAAGTTQ